MVEIGMLPQVFAASVMYNHESKYFSFFVSVNIKKVQPRMRRVSNEKSRSFKGHKTALRCIQVMINT